LELSKYQAGRQLTTNLTVFSELQGGCKELYLWMVFILRCQTHAFKILDSYTF